MQTPDKTPPLLENNEATISLAPTQQISEAAIKGMELEGAVPTMMPTEKAEAVTAFEAVVWNSDKRVNGLYTTLHAHNAWMSIAGLNWRKLAVTHDSSCEAMTLLAAHCREKLCRIDFAEENGVVKEMYVW